MMQTEKRRVRKIWSLRRGNPNGLWESVQIEEKFQAVLSSPAVICLRREAPMFMLCAFAAQGKLLGGAQPFAPALLAAVMARGCGVHGGTAGCLLGALAARSPDMLLACVLMEVVYICLRSAGLRPNDLTCVASAGVFVCGSGLIFAQDGYDVLMALAGGVSALILARMYVNALSIRLRDRALLSAEEMISLTLLFAGAAAGVRSIEICGASPVTALMMLLCAAAGKLGGAGAGALIGTMMGLVLGVTEPAQPWMSVGLSLTGLLCGVFSRMGRWGSAAAMPVAALLAGAMKADFLTGARLAELAAAFTALLCIKPSIWQRLRVFLDREAQVRRSAQSDPERLRAETADKLREYADLYGRMARLEPSGGQFSAVSTALKSIAQEVAQPVETFPERAREIAQALDGAGIGAQRVQVQKIGGKLRVQCGIACKRRDGLCDARLSRILSQVAGIPLRMRPAGVCPRDGLCSLVMEEACRYEVYVGVRSCAKEEGAACGDTLTTVMLPEGQYMIALADGMGHGREAQAESRAAVDLMEDFLLARFEPEAALYGVNDLMLRREGGERFSTMDLSLIDLQSGCIKAMKIGAVPSYVRRGRRIIELGGDALPMGIVERVHPALTQMQLEDGDLLVMVSDGIWDASGEGWLHDEILQLDARDPDAAAQHILDCAANLGGIRDDSTVCVARIVCRQDVHPS